MKIAVFGAGAWGSALASHAATGAHEVLLWSRDPGVADAIRRTHENPRYLPGQPLAPRLAATAAFADAVRFAGGGLAVVATPVGGLRATLERFVATGASPPVALLWLCKGVEAGTALMPHEVASQSGLRIPVGALSGPSFAQEVARGLPVAMVAASSAPAARETALEAFHHGAMRIYSSDDLLGVEIGGAVKNVMAIAAGISDGLLLGANARAALITRGLAEIIRLGVAVGARAATLTGLSGLGDLVLTCTGDLSRNRRVGLGLAGGRPLSAILDDLGHVAEGVLCAGVIDGIARRCRVDMPIVAAVVAVLEGRVRAAEAVSSLLAREPREEGASD